MIIEIIILSTIVFLLLLVLVMRRKSIIKIISRKVATIIAIVSVTIILSIEFIKYFHHSKWPILYQNLYVALLFVSLFIFLVILNNVTASKRWGMEGAFYYFFTIFFNLAFGFMMIVLYFNFTSNQLSILFMILMLILFSVLLVKQFRFLAGTPKRIQLIRFAFAIIITYLYLNLYILFTFGSYNLEFKIASFEQDISQASFIQILLAGGKYFFNYPEFKTNHFGVVPNFTMFAAILQYYIGLLVNVLILPFFISYYSSVLFNKENRNNNEVIEKRRVRFRRV